MEHFTPRYFKKIFNAINILLEKKTIIESFIYYLYFHNLVINFEKKKIFAFYKLF